MASTWSKVLEEFTAETRIPGPKAAWARVFARKVDAVATLTGRPLVVYGTACTSSGKPVSAEQLQIDPSDKIGFHDVIERLSGPNLDVILHSPGGFVEAAESIVEEIRRKFGHVRFIVPSYAKSAATMMAMAGDEILLDQDGELGPIDPQMYTQNGVAPAEAIKEQFLKASKEILADPNKLSLWIPILQPMGPALLVQCEHAIELGKRLVTEWLTRFMFKGVADGPARAKAVADYLATHGNFYSHARQVKIEHLAPFGLSLINLRTMAPLFAVVWEVYCTMDIIFANTPIYKLFYNSMHDAMVRQLPQQQIVLPGFPFQIPGQAPAPAPPAAPAPPSP